jgi:hypothetical protein
MFVEMKVADLLQAGRHCRSDGGVNSCLIAGASHSVTFSSCSTGRDETEDPLQKGSIHSMQVSSSRKGAP